MILSNWLKSLNFRRGARRRSWIDNFKSAESRTEQSVERLETRVYLSAVASAAQNFSNDWFATLESSSDESVTSHLLVRLTSAATSQAGNVAGVQNLFDAAAVAMHRRNFSDGVVKYNAFDTYIGVVKEKSQARIVWVHTSKLLLGTMGSN